MLSILSLILYAWRECNVNIIKSKDINIYITFIPCVRVVDPQFWHWFHPSLAKCWIFEHDGERLGDCDQAHLDMCYILCVQHMGTTVLCDDQWAVWRVNSFSGSSTFDWYCPVLLEPVHHYYHQSLQLYQLQGNPGTAISPWWSGISAAMRMLCYQSCGQCPENVSVFWVCSEKMGWPCPGLITCNCKMFYIT